MLEYWEQPINALVAQQRKGPLRRDCLHPRVPRTHHLFVKAGWSTDASLQAHWLDSMALPSGARRRETT